MKLIRTLSMAALAAASVPAFALLQLAFQQTLPTQSLLFVSCDNNPATAHCSTIPGVQIYLPDTLPQPNVLSVGSANINGILITGSVQIATVGPPQNILETSSSVIQNLNPFAVTGIGSISATDFTPPSSVATTSGSGTWTEAAGSSIALSWCDDPTNGQGADAAVDCPGDVIDSFSNTASSMNPTSFAHSGGPFAVNDTVPFSMTQSFVLDLIGGGSLTSRGQSEIKPTVAVGEPGPLPLVLLGSILTGFGAWRKRW